MGRWFTEYTNRPTCNKCGEKVGASRWYTINYNGSVTCVPCVRAEDERIKKAKENKEREERLEKLKRYRALQLKQYSVDLTQ